MENEKTKSEFTFRKHSWRQFKKNKPAYVSLWILGVLAFIALFAPVIANERPLMMKYKGHIFFPAFSFANNYEVKDEKTGETENIQLDICEWKKMNFDFVIWAPVPYSPDKADHENTNDISPGGKQEFLNAEGKIIPMPMRFRHFLGTSSRGEDVLSGLIHGARISLTIGFLSMSIASLLGLLLGSLAGFFGDERMQTSRGRFWTTIVGIILAWHYAFNLRSFSLTDALAISGLEFLKELFFSLLIFAFILVIFSKLGKQIGKIPWLNKRVKIPVDSLISRLIEVFISLPTFILILSVAAIAKPSFINLMVIIGLTSWTGIARLTRAEFLRIRNLEYIQAAKALGFSEYRTILKHALPNGISPALVSIAFGIASAILIESSLSFLGVGVPPETQTWGSLLFAGKENFSAWWLVLFPGIMIFITVTVYNLIGEGLRDALDPRQKN